MNLESTITSASKVPRCQPDTPIGTALSYVEHSHQPVFVYADDVHLIGMLSPYECLFRRRLPYTTKAMHAMIKPPKFISVPSLRQLLEFMLSSRLYSVPLFDVSDQAKVTGKISLRHVLAQIGQDKELMQRLSKLVSASKPVTANQDSLVGTVYNLMRDRDVSRIILVDDIGKVAGIVSRSDIEHAFIHPTPKQRFSTRHGSPVNKAFDDTENFLRQDEPSRLYVTHKVDTMSKDDPMTDQLTRVFQSQYHDVVLIDEDKIPTGIVTGRDVLIGLLQLQMDNGIPIIFKRPSQDVTDLAEAEAYEILQEFGKKIDKREPLQRLEISFNEAKFASGGTAEFTTTLKTYFSNGDYYVTNVQEDNFILSVRAATEQIEKQIERDKDNETYP